MQQLNIIEILVFNTFYGFTQHLLSFTDARHLLHFHYSLPKLWSTPTIFSAPEHFYSVYTRFCICLALTKKFVWYEQTFSASTNEFSQALQTTLLQLILLIFLSVTKLYISKCINNTSFYQCLN